MEYKNHYFISTTAKIEGRRVYANGFVEHTIGNSSFAFPLKDVEKKVEEESDADPDSVVLLFYKYVTKEEFQQNVDNGASFVKV